MYGKGIGILGLMMAIILGVTLNVSGQDTQSEMCVPTGTFKLKIVDRLINKEKVELKRSAVEFPHSQHFTIDCKDCHHKWEGKGIIQSCTASDCHDKIEAPKKADNYLSYDSVKIKYYKFAYHKQCITCHKDIKKKNKAIELANKNIETKLQKTGPTGCKGCHL